MPVAPYEAESAALRPIAFAQGRRVDAYARRAAVGEADACGGGVEAPAHHLMYYISCFGN